MADQTVTLRLTASSGELVGEIRTSKAALASLGESAERSGDRAGRGLNKTRAGVESISKQLDSAKRRAIQFFGVMMSFQTLRGVAAMADDWSNLGARLSLANKGVVEQAAALGGVYAVAQRTSTAVGTTGDLVARLSTSLGDMGMKSEAAFQKGLALSETINQTFALSGAAAAAQGNAITQFTQALAGGVLRAEEFNSVVENSPRLAKAMADGMKVGMGELRRMVNEGKVSASEMLRAIESQAGVIEEEFTRLPLTIGRAWVQIVNGIKKYIGTVDQAHSTSAKIARGMSLVAQNIDSIANAVILLGKVAATVYTLQLLQLGRQWVASLSLQTVAMRGLIVAQGQWAAVTAASFAAAYKSIGLLGIAFNTLASAFIGWSIGKYLREQFLQVRLAGIALVQGLVNGWTYVKQGALIAWEALKAGFLGALNVMRNALADFVGHYARLAGVIPDFLGGEKIAASLVGLEGRLRSTSPAADGFHEAVARINQEASATRSFNNEIFSDMADYEIAAEQAKNSAADLGATLDVATGNLQEHGKGARATANEVRRLAEAQASFARENDRMAAQLQGAVAVAWFEYRDGVEEARAALAKKEATLAEVERRERLLAQFRDRALAEAKEQQAAPDRLLADMRTELDLLGRIGVGRERQARRLRAEEEMRRAISEAEKTGIKLSEERVAWHVEEARRLADLSIVVEEYAADLEQLGRIGHGVIGGMADLFSDLFSGGIRKGRDFFRALRDIFRQGFRDIIRLSLDASFVRPLTDRMTAAITSAFSAAQGQVAAGSGGFAAAGQSGGWMQQLMGGLGQVFQRFFGAGRGIGAAAGGNVFTAQGGLAAIQAQGVDIGQIGGLVVSRNGMQAFASRAMPWLAAATGVAAGWNQGGDVPGKALGAAAYGTAAFAGYAAATAGAGALAAGGGLAAAGSAALGAIPVAGWIALAAIAVDKISGGKLFGTKFKAESAAQVIDFAGSGASGYDSVTEVRNRSLFRGREWRTTNTGFDAQAQQQIDRAFADMQKAIGQAAGQLGVDMPAFVAGSFRREFDSQGNLQREFGIIAGKVYSEAQEAFAQRLLGENLLAVAMSAGSGAEINRIAEAYRASGETLTEFATLMLAVQSDIKNARQVWSATGDGTITRVTELIEDLARAGETLAETYARVTEAARSYGNLIADAEKQIIFHGLNDWQRSQVEVELAYRSQVKQAHELAKQLGLTGARSEDLAKLEQLRAINMAKLQQQFEAQKNHFLDDLSLGALSPLRDAQKLTSGMDMLRQAVTAGDLQRAQQLSQQVLGIGRNLYASGADYNALYSEVTGLLDGIAMGEIEGLTDARLADIADLIEGLPDGIARALFDLAYSPQQHTVTVPVMPGPAPTPVTGAPALPQQPGGGAPLQPYMPGTPDDGRRMVDLLQQIVDQGERIERLETMRDMRSELIR